MRKENEDYSKEEIERNKKVKERILEYLRNKGEHGATNAELSKISLRYGAHIGKMYEEGYVVDKKCLSKGLFLYTLISEPEHVVVHKKAIDKLFEEINNAGMVSSERLRQIMDKNNITVKYKANTYRNKLA